MLTVRLSLATFSLDQSSSVTNIEEIVTDKCVIADILNNIIDYPGHYDNNRSASSFWLYYEIHKWVLVIYFMQFENEKFVPNTTCSFSSDYRQLFESRRTTLLASLGYLGAISNVS